jgi:2,3-bisphosphoglycerate-independent phosphoglycerate mutase
MSTNSNRPIVLLILDGWGIAQPGNGNAVSSAHTPYYDEIVNEYPWTKLSASGPAVGMKNGEAGNAEFGHMSIGAGRPVETIADRVQTAIETGSFFENKVLKEAFEAASSRGTAVHLVGMLSNSGLHSDPNALFALLRMAKQSSVENVCVHGILDGRDVPPRSADIFVEALEVKMADIGVGRIASLCGRYYGMDSSENWENTAKAYTMLVHGEGEWAGDAGAAIRRSFLRGISDEFTSPIIVEREPGIPVGLVSDGDVVIFFNHRADTMRQLVRAVAIPEPGSSASPKPRIQAVCLASYDDSFEIPIAFEAQALPATLASLLAANKIFNYRIAESDRMQYVTRHFNGGIGSTGQYEQHFPIDNSSSPDRERAPEMQNFKVVNQLIKGLDEDPDGVFIVDLASPGSVAETGNFGKTVEAVQFADTCLGGILKKVRSIGGVAIVTATHGNCESMFDLNGEPDRHATSSPVPFHLIDLQAGPIALRSGGTLHDIAPTILGYVGIGKPDEMTGNDLRYL